MKTKIRISESQLKSLKEYLKTDLDEYGYDEFDHKQSAMPSDRKNKIVNWAKDRQISQGVTVNAVTNDGKIVIMPSDIEMSKRDEYLDNYFKQSEGVKYRTKKDYPLSSYIKRYPEYSVEFTAYGSLYMPSKEVISVDIKLYGKLSLLNDKDWPKLSFDVSKSSIEYHGAGRMVPENRKGANQLSQKLKSLLLDYYGKYQMPRKGEYRLFIPEINIHPNSFTA